MHLGIVKVLRLLGGESGKLGAQRGKIGEVSSCGAVFDRATPRMVKKFIRANFQIIATVLTANEANRKPIRSTKS